MIDRRYRTLLAAVVAVPTLALVGPVAQATATSVSAPVVTKSDRLLTLYYSRALYAVAANCRPVPGVVTMFQVADELRRRGYAGSASVVLSRTSQSMRNCERRTQSYMSWDDMKRLYAGYGWRFFSAGNHDNITTLPPSEQRAQSCGTIKTINNKIAGPGGDAGANGMYAYPSNHFTFQIQDDIVSKCFYFGRRTGSSPNPLDAARLVHGHWMAKSGSINGGACNDPSLPCYNLNTGRRYDSPDRLAALMTPAAGEWNIVQNYRFVGGSRASSSGPTWDCTPSKPWQAHWTSQNEVYCWGDYKKALNAIPAAVKVVDPQTVGKLFRSLPVNP